MKLFVDLPQSQAEQVQRLVEKKKYESAYQFVKHAIETMIHIEESDVEITSSASTGPKVRTVVTKSNKDIVAVKKSPAFLKTRNLAVKTFEPNKHEELWSDSERNAPWIWGQINNVLGIKYCVRALTNMLRERNTPFIPLDLFVAELRKYTAETKLYLKNLDQLYKRDRDSKYSKSFPEVYEGRQDDTEKSFQRFETQYIGRSRKHGWVDGVICLLGFAQLSPTDLNLRLTEYGLAFSNAKNPVFDEELTAEPMKPLSEDEIAVYMKAVKEFSLAERNSLGTIARLIVAGNDRPQSLDAALSKQIPNWTPAQVTTYRAGAIARLGDLAFLTKRKRNGGNGAAAVQYQIDKEKFQEFLSIG